MAFVSNTVKHSPRMIDHRKRSPLRVIDAALHGETRAILSVHLLLYQDSRPLPSESEMQAYFGVTPPTVHQMVRPSKGTAGLRARQARRGRSDLLLPSG